MNRREALASLTVLPGVLPGLTRISKADLKPDDVIVLECEQRVNEDTANRLVKQAEAIWPGQRVILLADGLKMKVVSK